MFEGVSESLVKPAQVEIGEDRETPEYIILSDGTALVSSNGVILTID